MIYFAVKNNMTADILDMIETQSPNLILVHCDNIVMLREDDYYQTILQFTGSVILLSSLPKLYDSNNFGRVRKAFITLVSRYKKSKTVNGAELEAISKLNPAFETMYAIRVAKRIQCKERERDVILKTASISSNLVREYIRVVGFADGRFDDMVEKYLYADNSLLTEYAAALTNSGIDSTNEINVFNGNVEYVVRYCVTTNTLDQRIETEIDVAHIRHAVHYAEMLKRRIFRLESNILRDPNYAERYIRGVLLHPSVFTDDIFNTVDVSCVTPKTALDMLRKVGKRIPALESRVGRSGAYAYEYATKILHAPFEDAEPKILDSAKRFVGYCTHFNVRRKEYERKFSSVPIFKKYITHFGLEGEYKQ